MSAATAIGTAGGHQTDPAGPRPRRPRWPRWSGSISVLASYLALFGLLAWPWITSAHEAIPRGGRDFDPDNILIVWVLAWVAHALGTAPASLFGPPINYPAPLQLAGSEHFGSSQVVFGPVFWLTGNAVLGANVAALLSYPLGAWAMQRLLIAVGCAGGAAWVAGLVSPWVRCGSPHRFTPCSM